MMEVEEQKDVSLSEIENNLQNIWEFKQQAVYIC